ncbi:Adenylate cyclase-associated CAP [Parasponia andersonii]|uniref:Adenylate cyclase-associated CAP n=1 Tax=Parasponia andersonii TaxID=3476 RepID=A0A2P5DAC5_PARAD|nr:Adenylate cyclase-associated CAP [Parasponia andersonii]
MHSLEFSVALLSSRSKVRLRIRLLRRIWEGRSLTLQRFSKKLVLFSGTSSSRLTKPRVLLPLCKNQTLARLAEFLKPVNEVITKANKLIEGSLSALAWIAYTGKECGISMPIAHVEESRQMAEFYNKFCHIFSMCHFKVRVQFMDA